jgi:3-dehydroquinate dehydratase/shikimate dehydrogenase
MEEIRRNRDLADGADMVEMRLDTVDRPDAAGALEGRLRPVIVTCRAEWEGGHFRGSEEERRAILEQAVAHGAEFIDVEARAAFAPELIRLRRGRGVILSSHYFDGVPADLTDRWRSLKSAGAEVSKLAAAAASLTDTLQIMQLAEKSDGGDESPGHVLIAMGQAGFASRVLASRAGNRWTYTGRSVAPGQIPSSRLLTEFRFRDLRPDSAVYGVVGNPVGHSRSPVMHNAGFAHAGLDAIYLPLEAADAADFVRFARGIGLTGASITAPFKIDMMQEVDELEPLARRVGAINTLVVRDGRWIGANTDVHGFTAPLAARMTMTGVRATILGAGGAARAVAVALADMAAVVTVSARRDDAAREIARLAGGSAGAFPPPGGSWDVLVNAIPAGPDAARVSPIGDAPLDGELVYDLVYAPAVTRLLSDAKAQGLRTIGGLEMLVAQAERQFELWTGQAPPAGLFQQAAGQAQS